MSADSVNRSTGRRSYGRQPAASKRPLTRDLTCKQEIAFIDDYLAASLDSELSRAFDAHLSACPDCVAFLATYRKTVEITGHFLRLQSAKQKPRRLTFRTNKALTRR
jgi:anti-sigma factor RsiW